MGDVVKTRCRTCGKEISFVPPSWDPQYLPTCHGEKMVVFQIVSGEEIAANYCAFWAGMDVLGYRGPGGPEAQRFREEKGLSLEEVREIGRKRLKKG